ncbi:MAG: hypothetical protein R3E42_16470 [Burkholderiaceae bacterium]
MSTPDAGHALACASNQFIFLAGETGPVWRVVEGVVRLDRAAGPVCQPVQLALPGDLVGSEVLCGQPYQYSAMAFTPCRLEPVPRGADGSPGPLLQQALLQQIERSQDMAQLRTGSVMQRLTHMLALLGLGWRTDQPPVSLQADAIRRALPTLREVALLVDAKTETVCRALAQLLPPRKRRPGGVSPAPGRMAGGWSAHVNAAGSLA